jgi:hypothetical protein
MKMKAIMVSLKEYGEYSGSITGFIVKWKYGNLFTENFVIGVDVPCTIHYTKEGFTVEVKERENG